jgi:hypothetical protein
MSAPFMMKTFQPWRKGWEPSVVRQFPWRNQGEQDEFLDGKAFEVGEDTPLRQGFLIHIHDPHWSPVCLLYIMFEGEPTTALLFEVIRLYVQEVYHDAVSESDTIVALHNQTCVTAEWNFADLDEDTLDEIVRSARRSRVFPELLVPISMEVAEMSRPDVKVAKVAGAHEMPIQDQPSLS